MTELEKLLEQRKELDKKIKALKCPMYVNDAGTAKFFVRTRHGEPLDNWVVTLKTVSFRGGNTQFKEIVVGNTKEECLEGLAGIIYSLNSLYDMVNDEDSVDNI